MTAPIVSATPQAIAKACAILRAGGLVAIPTETVYGLAADASNPAAVARLYATKQRPQFNPLIAHVPNLAAAQQEGQFSPLAVQLAQRFWPGPLSLVVNISAGTQTCDLARAGLDSLALRVPNHPATLALLSAYQAPLVAPSANPSGRISPTQAAHVARDLGDDIDLILDGGPCTSGLESTILDVRHTPPTLLRSGSLPKANLESLLPSLRLSESDPSAPRAPGQLLRHYAPRARLRLNADVADAGEAHLGFGPMQATLNLSERGDLREAAQNLFAMLRTLDATHTAIAVAPIPNYDLGEAINDRLTRAASATTDPKCPSPTPS